MSNPANCPKCETLFSQHNPPKLLINCSHTLCLACLQSEILCPIDHKRIERRKYTLEKFQTNYALLPHPDQQSLKHAITEQEEQIITQDQLTTENKFLKSGGTQMIGPAKQQTVTAPKELPTQQKQQKIVKENTQKVVRYEASKTQERTSPIKVRQQQHIIEFQRCLLHSKNAELICVQDKCVICPSCALFGQHRHHKLLPYQNYLLTYTTLAEQCLSINKDISRAQNKITKQTLTIQIEEELKKKHQKEAQLIHNYTNRLITLIQQSETHTLAQLDHALQLKKEKVLRLIEGNQLPRQINEFHKTVDLLNYGLKSIFKVDSIHQFIDYVDQNHPKSYTANEGEYLLMEINNYHKTTTTLIQQQINQITHEFANKDQNILNEFITLKSKDSPQQPSQSHKHQITTNKENQSQEFTHSNNVPCTPILKKNNDEEMLINNSIDRQELKQPLASINSNSVSPIKPIGNFEYVLDCQFMNNSREELVNMSQIRLPSKEMQRTHNIYNKTITLKTNRKQEKNQSHSMVRLSHVSRNKSISAYNTEKELISILTDKNENKKKKKIDLPQKYLKIYDDLLKDTLQVLDLGGASLGDTLVYKISQILPSRTKLKTVKLMNNKIGDDMFPELIIRCTNIQSLNLSYNNLTEKSLDFLQQEADRLGSLSNLTLSNNKIVLRNVKERLEGLRRKGIKVSL